MNLNRQTFTTTFADKPLTLEVSRLAEQATQAVIGKYGETEVLVTTMMSGEDKPLNYLPLLVDYEERFYAAGKIIGSRFIRREGRPSDEAILSGRIVDRVIRPLFDHRMRRNIQVVITVLAIDEKSDPDFIALLSASLALSISEIPWAGPVAGVKILLNNSDQLLINPGNIESQNGFKLSSFVAGTGEFINMIELEGVEAKEDETARALASAHEEIKKLIHWQKEIIKKIGREKTPVKLVSLTEELKTKVKEFLAPKLEEAIFVKEKKERGSKELELKARLKEFLTGLPAPADAFPAAELFMENEIDALVHEKILKEGLRPDGRALDEIRELYSEVGLIKRTHGSAVFMRGNTQALAVTTLGPPGAAQLVETIEFTGKKKFLLHYNFPPYSVGEIGPFRGPGRREIGHGSLANKAIRSMIPTEDEFPYTIRVVSEVLSSNGSSSMATVCATSLSLMDAGVPIKKAVAGIAMGLIIDQGLMTNDQRPTYKILTDIQGPEDHYGDMDFKVAGTDEGLTAVQMDVKIKGITPKMAGEILAEAKEARLKILEAMKTTLAKPRENISPYAPIILTLAIPPSKIGEVIGPGGKIINGIIADTGVMSIDIEEDGRVFITGESKEKAEAALKMVKEIVKTYEVGEIVEGKIVKILDFGAIMSLGPRQDGLIHISELKDGYVKSVAEVLKLGDKVRAKIIRVDPDGRIGLSLKGVAK